MHWHMCVFFLCREFYSLFFPHVHYSSSAYFFHQSDAFKTLSHCDDFWGDMWRHTAKWNSLFLAADNFEFSSTMFDQSLVPVYHDISSTYLASEQDLISYGFLRYSFGNLSTILRLLCEFIVFFFHHIRVHSIWYDILRYENDWMRH